jgi:hypothetical protein
MPVSERNSYAWALHLDASAVPYMSLSADARAGLLDANDLAEDASNRVLQNLRNSKSFPPLMVEDIAGRERLPVETVERRIAAARAELFGAVGMSAIYKRIARRQQRAGRSARRCAEPGCKQPLDPELHLNRRYCDRHRQPSANTRRHRNRRLNPSPKSRHPTGARVVVSGRRLHGWSRRPRLSARRCEARQLSRLHGIWSPAASTRMTRATRSSWLHWSAHLPHWSRPSGEVPSPG